MCTADWTRVGWPELLERVLEAEGVDDRGQHAHLVGLGAVHALAGTDLAPPDVAAADDDGDVGLEVLADLDDLVGQLPDDGAVDAEAALAGEGLPGELEDDPRPARLGHRSVRPRRPTTWANRTMSASPSSALIVTLSSLTKPCSRSTRSLNQPVRRPSTILSRAASGLPSARVIDSRVARSSATSASGTSSRRVAEGLAKAMCTAMSWATSVVPPSSSTITPLTPRPSWRWM